MNKRRSALFLTPLCILAGLMTMAALSPAGALFKKEIPVMAPLTAAAENDRSIHFTAEDFTVTGGTLSGIVVESLPEGGTLTLGGQPLSIGSVVPFDVLGTMAFIPDEEAPEQAGFDILPVFAGQGRGQAAVSVSLDLSGRANSAPVARNAALETFCGLPLTGHFSAVDPEGDAVTYEVQGQPAHGTVTVDGDTFRYVPVGSKARTDAFTYVAVDPSGKRSAPAAVTIDVQAAQSGLSYADMGNDPNHYAAVRLAELGVLQGERVGSHHFLRPEQTVSRAQFVAMAAVLCDLPVPTAAVSTGMADNEDVPVWARASMAAAMQNDLIVGEQQANGNSVLRAGDPITHAETAVILDRMLCLPDDGRKTDYAASLPAWAAQAVVNTVEGGYLALDENTFDPAAPLTRSEAAACLYRAYQTMHAEKSFWDIF